jgi:poly(hydroxyalkanoate) depolymerase family esterase
LKMLSYVPALAAPKAPLVVVLHGCTQTASAYADHAGWRQLADHHGFALLCPEQQTSNNAKRCFNWFLADDTARMGGECQSIAEMINFMVHSGRVDPSRVFVTGLSAGGAMAAAMLATYPEMFAGGSIVAGLPYGAAHNVQGAFEAMFQPRAESGKARGQRVRRASRHEGSWPPIAIWHGDQDRTVVPANAEELAKQWLDVHGITGAGETRREGRVTHTRWSDGAGLQAVDLYMIGGMAHGAPISVAGREACGHAAPFLLDVGISSSLTMAQEWGLASGKVQMLPTPATIEAEEGPEPEAPRKELGGYIEDVIHRALAAAGLVNK